MRTWRWFAAAFVSFATVAGAEGPDLSSRVPAAPTRIAADAAHPASEWALHAERKDVLLHPSCREQGLCYDAAEGRLVYRGARRYMPPLSGMQPEGLSLRRDRLVLRYSFK